MNTINPKLQRMIDEFASAYLSHIGNPAVLKHNLEAAIKFIIQRSSEKITYPKGNHENQIIDYISLPFTHSLYRYSATKQNPW